jgi:hypothetical protein
MKMEHIVNIIGHIAWPATVLVIGYFAQDEIRKIFGAIAKRIEEKNTDVSIGKEGLPITTAMEATEAKLEAQEVDIEQVRSLILDSIQSSKVGVNVETCGEIDSNLRKLADDYMNIKISDWSERVRAKDEAARKLGNYVITNKISKDILSSEHHEGIILALASSIHAMPEKGDTERLLRVSDEVNRLHVKYRIVLAFGRLIERGIAGISDIPRIRHVLRMYESDSDSALKKRINATYAILNRVIHESET